MSAHITPASPAFWKLNAAQWITICGTFGSVAVGVVTFILGTRWMAIQTAESHKIQAQAQIEQAKHVEAIRGEFQKQIEFNRNEIQKLNVEGTAASRTRLEREHADIQAYEIRLQRAEAGNTKLAVIENQITTMASDIKEIKAELKSHPGK